MVLGNWTTDFGEGQRCLLVDLSVFVLSAGFVFKYTLQKE